MSFHAESTRNRGGIHAESDATHPRPVTKDERLTTSPAEVVASTRDEDEFTFVELTFSLAEIRALLCHRAVCHPHILDRITADRKLRRALEAGL